MIANQTTSFWMSKGIRLTRPKLFQQQSVTHDARQMHLFRERPPPSSQGPSGQGVQTPQELNWWLTGSFCIHDPPSKLTQMGVSWEEIQCASLTLIKARNGNILKKPFQVHLSLHATKESNKHFCFMENCTNNTNILHRGEGWGESLGKYALSIWGQMSCKCLQVQWSPAWPRAGAPRKPYR